MLSKLLSFIPTPWLVGIVVAALAVSHIYVYNHGKTVAENEIAATALKSEQLKAELERTVSQEIAKIQIINKTIYRNAEREIIREPVYRDCVHSSDGLRSVNDALRPRTERKSDTGVSKGSGGAD